MEPTDEVDEYPKMESAEVIYYSGETEEIKCVVVEPLEVHTIFYEVHEGQFARMCRIINNNGIKQVKINYGVSTKTNIRPIY